jgi:hypothetical protein
MEDCIEFKGCKNKGGYGVKGRAGKIYLAHRIAYCEAKNIYIKDIDGLVVMHTCDNPACVNPEHLRLGTQKDNVYDMMKKGRHDFVGVVGEAHGHAKLTSEDVLRIREIVKFKTQREVGKLFGISQQHVSDILRRKYWEHIPEQSSIDE